MATKDHQVNMSLGPCWSVITPSLGWLEVLFRCCWSLLVKTLKFLGEFRWWLLRIGFVLFFLGKVAIQWDTGTFITCVLKWGHKKMIQILNKCHILWKVDVVWYSGLLSVNGVYLNKVMLHIKPASRWNYKDSSLGIIMYIVFDIHHKNICFVYVFIYLPYDYIWVNISSVSGTCVS